MTHVWLVYGVALVAVIVRSWTAAPYLRLAAFVFLADWLGSNALHWFAGFDYRPLFPLADLAFGASFFFAWALLRKPWVLVVAALYGISSLAGLLAYGFTKEYSFDLALNAAFLARLAVVWISSSEPRKAQETT